MTSQEEKTERDELNKKAKALGIVSPHLFGMEKLLQKIAEAEVVPEVEVVAEVVVAAPVIKPEPVVERKVAPKMVVTGRKEDSRTKRIKELEAANPGVKYITKKAGTTPAQLKAIGLESTGEYLKNDLICCTDKDSYEGWLDERNAGARRTMDSIDTEGTKIKSHTAQAKVPYGK